MMRRLIIAALALITALSLCACEKAPENRVFDASDLKGRRVGTLLGSPAEAYLNADGISSVSYTSSDDIRADLISGGLDCVVADGDFAKELARSSKLEILETPLVSESYRIMVARENKELAKDLNNAVNELVEEDTVDELIEKYRSGKMPESSYTEPDPETDRFLIAAIDPTFHPYCGYDENGVPGGLEAEIAAALCQKLGLGIKFEIVPPGELMTSVQNGYTSFAIGRLTLDGADKVLLTDPYMTSEQYIVVRK